MSLNSLTMNNALHGRDVNANTRMSQSSGAANTVSSFIPKAKSAQQATQNSQQTTTFASMTQAYKESYDKFIKNSSSDKLSFKALQKLDQILEENTVVKEQKEPPPEHHKPLDFLA